MFHLARRHRDVLVEQPPQATEVAVVEGLATVHFPFQLGPASESVLPRYDKLRDCQGDLRRDRAQANLRERVTAPSLPQEIFSLMTELVEVGPGG
jgi:hypothetical protein